MFDNTVVLGYNEVYGTIIMCFYGREIIITVMIYEVRAIWDQNYQ